MDTKHLKITNSLGRGKYGTPYVYVRPAKNCFNRSRRVRFDRLEKTISRHFPLVNYYMIDGHVIGAKNKEYGLKEYWRVCEKAKIKQSFSIELIPNY